MNDDEVLPEAVKHTAHIIHGCYVWRISDVENAIELCRQAGLLCLGGEVQFFIDGGICEAYWLCFDASERNEMETWQEYVDRAAKEVGSLFRQRCNETDFVETAKQWEVLSKRIEDPGFDPMKCLVFALDFVTEEKQQQIARRIAAGPRESKIHCFHCGRLLIKWPELTRCTLSGMCLSLMFEKRLLELIRQDDTGAEVLATSGKSNFFCPRCGMHLSKANQVGTVLQCSKCLLKLDSHDVFEIVERHPHRLV